MAKKIIGFAMGQTGASARQGAVGQYILTLLTLLDEPPAQGCAQYLKGGPRGRRQGHRAAGTAREL